VSDGLTGEHLKVSMIEFAYQWFNRAVALYCLLLGLAYWIRLVGFYEGTLWRFDLMPPYWQVPAVTLAVLFPLAASGLWMLASWGPVIWFTCALVETIMYAGFAELYGARPAIVVIHGIVLLLFLAFRGVLLLDQRRRDDTF
jgi:hypothetical protein